ncbi:hypothetical protein BH10CHL1_BH10CHL1_47960 [soil metagenome]
MVELAWDEPKRQIHLGKQGFDFADASELLTAAHLEVTAFANETEPRINAIGLIPGRFAAIIFTLRGHRYRIISVRSARCEERAAYAKTFGTEPNELGQN